jgi:hypothetical protein
MDEIDNSERAAAKVVDVSVWLLIKGLKPAASDQVQAGVA